MSEIHMDAVPLKNLWGEGWNEGFGAALDWVADCTSALSNREPLPSPPSYFEPQSDYEDVNDVVALRAALQPSRFPNTESWREPITELLDRIPPLVSELVALRRSAEEAPPAVDTEAVRQRLREWVGNWEELGDNADTERDFITYILKGVIS